MPGTVVTEDKKKHNKKWRTDSDIRTKVLAVRVTEQQAEDLQRLAARHGITMSEAIHRLLDVQLLLHGDILGDHIRKNPSR